MTKKKWDSWWLLLVLYVFVLFAWIVYRLDTESPILFFASLGGLIFLGNTVMAFQMKPSDWEIGPKNVFSKLRFIFPGMAGLVFLFFVIMSQTYGGSPMTEEWARNVVEGYVDGAYYLTNHGVYTAVAYEVWQTLSMVELLLIPLFGVSILWNLAYQAKTKRLLHLEAANDPPKPEESGVRMTKKQFRTFAVLGLGMGLFSVTVLILAAEIQESSPEAGIILGISGFIGLVGFCVYLIAYYKKILEYEIQTNLDKNKDMTLLPLIPLSFEISEANLFQWFERQRHGKAGNDLYWVFRRDPWLGNTTFLIRFVYDMDMSQTKEDEKEESEMTEEEIEQWNRHLPRGHQNGSHATVEFNLCESVDESQIAQARQWVTNAEILSRSLGALAPVGLFFLYDKSTKTLYCEPYRRYRLYPRQRAMKRFYKILGIFEQTSFKDHS